MAGRPAARDAAILFRTDTLLANVCKPSLPVAKRRRKRTTRSERAHACRKPNAKVGDLRCGAGGAAPRGKVANRPGKLLFFKDLAVCHAGAKVANPPGKPRKRCAGTADPPEEGERGKYRGQQQTSRQPADQIASHAPGALDDWIDSPVRIRQPEDHMQD